MQQTMSQMSPWLYALMKSIFTGLDWEGFAQQGGVTGMPMIEATTQPAENVNNPGRSSVYNVQTAPIKATPLHHVRPITGTPPIAATPAPGPTPVHPVGQGTLGTDMMTGGPGPVTYNSSGRVRSVTPWSRQKFQIGR